MFFQICRYCFLFVTLRVLNFTHMIKHTLLLFAFFLPTLLQAEIPEGYYNSVNGLKKSELKSAFRAVISKANVLAYGSGAGKTWTGFYSTDRYNGNQVRDRYSNEIHYFASGSSSSSASAPNGMNIEHSFPKSWWGGTENQAYKDLFNLMPSESKINSSKSNYAMGTVTKINVDNGCTKIGTGSAGGKNVNLWEPADQWKGDFARSYFYMVTSYSNLSWTGEGLNMLENNEYPTLQKWAYDLFCKWNREDPVDDIERERNEAVYKIQGNRNPFIDFPNLPEYIWGDSINYTFSTDGTSTDIIVPEPIPDVLDLLAIDFTQSVEGWTVQDVSLPEGFTYVWRQNQTYGMKATAFANSMAYAAESWLISPELDLSYMNNAELTFTHAGRYFNDPQKEATLWVTTDDGENWMQLAIETHVTNTNWDYVTNTCTLDNFCGKKIKLGFKYLSTAEAAGTWEIKTVEVKGILKGAYDSFIAYDANEIVSSVYSTRFDANWAKYKEGVTYTLNVYTQNENGELISLEGYPVTTTDNTYRVKNVTPGTTYYYQVFVYDESGTLVAMSNEVQVDFPEIKPEMTVSSEVLSFAAMPGIPSQTIKVTVTLVATPEKATMVRVEGPFEAALKDSDDADWKHTQMLQGDKVSFYVRLQAQDEEGDYEGRLILSTTGVEEKIVALIASVDSQKSFFEDFETGSKGAYAIGSVDCSAASWEMDNALIGKDVNGYGGSVRMKSTGTLTMISDKTMGCDSLWFYAGLYGKDTGMTLTVYSSSDMGENWDPVVSNLELSTWQRYGFEIKQDGNIRLKFVADGPSSKRLNLDDIQMNNYIPNDADVLENVAVKRSDSRVYDMSGRLVCGRPVRGLYIIDGKKFLSK